MILNYTKTNKIGELLYLKSQHYGVIMPLNLH